MQLLGSIILRNLILSIVFRGFVLYLYDIFVLHLFQDGMFHKFCLKKL